MLMNQPVEISERWRLFIAMAAPEGVRAEIEKTHAEMRRALRESRITWTRREHFHLTLKFLGDVEASRVEELSEALRGACRGFGALNLRAEGVGCFPNLRHPRVIWVGVRDEQEQLSRLADKIETTVSDFTLEEREERFSGHITLGRIKELYHSENEKLVQMAQDMAQRSFGQWRADTIDIMRSELTSQGPRYTELCKIQLE
jgi:RNA 2',3'-cyclic 3'-phosphodiesterase